MKSIMNQSVTFSFHHFQKLTATLLSFRSLQLHREIYIFFFLETIDLANQVAKLQIDSISQAGVSYFR